MLLKSRALAVFLLLLVGLCLLIACGKKGPLYLPDKSAPTAPATPTPPAQ